MSKSPLVVKMLKSKVFLLFVGLIVCFLFFFVFDSQPKKQEGESILIDAGVTKRTFYTKNEIEKLIKRQVLQEIEKSEEVVGKSVVIQKRNLKTDIIVYVEKKENKVFTEKVIQEKESKVGVKIPTGTKLKGSLLNSIFSFNVSSPVIVVTNEDYIQNEVVVVPKGTQLIGQAGILKSKDRVNIKFNTMVFPDGREIKIKAMALSLDGSGGLVGEVDKEYDQSFLKGTAQMVLAGASLVLGTQDRPVTLEDELRLMTARNLTEDAEEAVKEVKIVESITVDAYTPLFVLFLSSIQIELLH